MAVVNVVCEGASDVPALHRIIIAAGHEPGRDFITRGKNQFDSRCQKFLNAAQNSAAGCWLLVRDLDNDAECAPELVSRIGRDQPENPPAFGRLRIAVRAIEAWALADADAFSVYYGVARSLLPDSPDSVSNPKAEIVRLARKSRKKMIRNGIVPSETSGRVVGTAYHETLIRYFLDHWDPDRASVTSDSLLRTAHSLQTL